MADMRTLTIEPNGMVFYQEVRERSIGYIRLEKDGSLTCRFFDRRVYDNSELFEWVEEDPADYTISIKQQGDNNKILIDIRYVDFPNDTFIYELEQVSQWVERTAKGGEEIWYVTNLTNQRTQIKSSYSVPYNVEVYDGKIDKKEMIIYGNITELINDDAGNEEKYILMEKEWKYIISDSCDYFNTDEEGNIYSISKEEFTKLFYESFQGGNKHMLFFHLSDNEIIEMRYEF